MMAENEATQDVGLSRLAYDKLRSNLEKAEAALQYFREAGEAMGELTADAEKQVAQFALAMRMGNVDNDALKSFFRQPFPRLEPARNPDGSAVEGAWRLIIPRFIPLNVGYLETQDEAWNYFRVNRFMDWFGEIPEFIKKQIGWVQPPDLRLEGEELVGSPDAIEKAWKELRPYLSGRVGDRLLVNKESAYDLMVALLKKGVKPFSDKPVAPEDLVESRCDYELRDYQRAIWDIFLKKSSVGVFIPPGQGKCHKRGQKLLMYDGSLKAVEDILPGDLLMGPDSKPRTVLSISQGYGDMVEVMPNKGAPWVVNQDHVLTLVRSREVSHKSTKWSKGYYRRYHQKREGEVIDIPVSEFVHLSKSGRSHLKLFHVGVDFPTIGPIVFPVDPYFLGVILGDGGLARGSLDVTTMETAIAREIRAQATRFGLGLRETASGQATTYVFTQGTPTPRDARGHSAMHDLGLRLRALGLFPIQSENRFIPREYLVASRNVRAELLAGLIDTDGHFDDKGWCYDYITKSRRLADGVAFLARSIGLFVTITPCNKSALGVIGHYFRLRIGGELWRVPCRVDRKRAPFRTLRRDPLRDGFQIRSVGAGEYYGFTLDGDGRYLLDDFTVTHNTVIGVYAATHLKPPHLIVVPTVTLVEQWTDRLEANTDLKVGEDVVISTYQMAIKRFGERQFTLKVYDEVHHLPADYFIKLSWIKSKYSIGLSATPYREDNRGRDIGGEEMIFALTGEPTGLAWQRFKELKLIKNPSCTVWVERNAEGKARRLDLLLRTPMKTIIFSDSLDMGRQIASKYGIPFVYGASTERLKTLDEAQTAVVSRVGDEGVSLPELERVIEMSWLFGSRRQELQRFTRLLHSKTGEGEAHVIMTLEEWVRDKKRFYSIMDKGFVIKVKKEGVEEQAIRAAEARVAAPRPRVPRNAMSEPPTPPAFQVAPGITSQPGVQKIMARMNKPTSAAFSFLLSKDGQWVAKSAMWRVLGYSTPAGMSKVDFGFMEKSGWVEKKRDGGQVYIRTNVTGAAA